jgi:hypothetical protein
MSLPTHGQVWRKATRVGVRVARRDAITAGGERRRRLALRLDARWAARLAGTRGSRVVAWLGCRELSLRIVRCLPLRARDERSARECDRGHPHTPVHAGSTATRIPGLDHPTLPLLRFRCPRGEGHPQRFGRRRFDPTRESTTTKCLGRDFASSAGIASCTGPPLRVRDRQRKWAIDMSLRAHESDRRRTFMRLRRLVAPGSPVCRLLRPRVSRSLTGRDDLLGART